MEPFISLWVGKQYILPVGVLIVLSINFYIQGIRSTSAVFQEAAGLFYEDRYISLLEAIINIIVSIILVKKIGLVGVFLGTIISTFVLFFYTFPIIIYKPLFDRNYFQYLKDYVLYIFITALSAFITYILCKNVVVSNIMLKIIINLGFVIVIPNLIYTLVFFKTDEFKYYKTMIKKFPLAFKLKLKK